MDATQVGPLFQRLQGHAVGGQEFRGDDEVRHPPACRFLDRIAGPAAHQGFVESHAIGIVTRSGEIVTERDARAGQSRHPTRCRHIAGHGDLVPARSTQQLRGLGQGGRERVQRGILAAVSLTDERSPVLPHERDLIKTFVTSLRRPDRLSWYGADRVITERNGEGRVGLVCANIEGYAPAEVGAILDEQFDIAVRPGLHCAPYAHKHLGTFPQGTVRLSVGILTTADEMRRAAAAYDDITAG